MQDFWHLDTPPLDERPTTHLPASKLLTRLPDLSPLGDDDNNRWQMFRFWQQGFLQFCAEHIERDPHPAAHPMGRSIDLAPVILPLARRYAWLDFQRKLWDNLLTRYAGKGISFDQLAAGADPDGTLSMSTRAKRIITQQAMEVRNGR